MTYHLIVCIALKIASRNGNRLFLILTYTRTWRILLCVDEATEMLQYKEQQGKRIRKMFDDRHKITLKQ